MNIAVFCSGNGSNFQAIVDASKEGLFKGYIALMVCDNPNAYAIKRAEKESIRTFIIERSNFPSKEEFERRIIEELEKENIELICLAGYMRILSDKFVKKYRNRILNIHPALLPLFKGAHGIKDALDNKASVTGATVHFVTEKMDSGPIILQESVKIKKDDTENSLAERIHKIEHRLYPEAIRLFTEGKLKVAGKKVKILAAALIFFLVFGFRSEAMIGSDIVTPVSIELLSTKTLEAPLYISYENAPVIYDTRLELFPFSIYDMQEVLPPASDNTEEILNAKIDIEKPLTKEEIEKMRIDTSFKAADVLTEVMDSLNLQLAHNGSKKIIDIASKVVDFREHMGNKYNLHLRADTDKAFASYRKKF